EDSEKWSPGERNDGLACRAGTMGRRGRARDASEAALVAENRRRCDPPLSEAEVKTIAASVARYQPAAKAEDRGPLSLFTVTDEGVYYKKDDGDAVKLAARIDVVAETRDGAGNNWGRLLRWLDSERRPHEWAMPMELLSSDAGAVRARVLSEGLPYLTTNQRLRERFAEYLQTWPVDQR